MVLTTLKQIKGTDLPGPTLASARSLCQPVTVIVSGYYYLVNMGPDTRPQYHSVGKDRHCTCGLGADCPAVKAVAEYLRSGGERAPNIPSGFFPVAPQACPICGAETYYVPDLTSHRRGAGWACVKGSVTHYWLAHATSLRKALESNPWIFPPVVAEAGQVFYPGLKRDEIIIESRPWPDGYNPHQ
jgi:hypothetical protein